MAVFPWKGFIRSSEDSTAELNDAIKIYPGDILFPEEAVLLCLAAFLLY